ncbi:Lipopolysaccharide-induced tumor necrosis factor-alpha factor, partial [Fasciolopsis buskii]
GQVSSVTTVRTTLSSPLPDYFIITTILFLLAPRLTPGTVPVVQQPNVCVQQVAFGPSQTITYCGNCNQQVVTHVRYVTGALTWLLCAVIFFFTGPLFCFLIPFCVDDCKDVVHSCPHCNVTLGTYRRL